MRRWFRWWSGAFVAILVVGMVSPAWAGDDVQTWHSADLAKKLGSRWEFAWLPEIRIRRDASQLFRHEYRHSLRWKASPHLQIAVNYLFARDESSGKPREEHTGELDVTPKASVGPWDLSVRGRAALRTIQRSAGEQEWQLRVMPKVGYRMTFAGRPITPYVADDLFYEYTRDAWNQNRLFLGAVVPLPAPHGVQLNVDAYYMLQSQLGSARGDWSSNHILGTKLVAKF